MAERRTRFSDYLELAKPEITGVVVLTVAAGFWAGRTGADGERLALAFALLGTGLASAGTGALNMVIEASVDARMSRTATRPLPAGRLRTFEALLFGILGLVGGVLLLAGSVNIPAASLTAATAALYLFAYTPLKRVSNACMLVGAVPGALPPAIGWAAARGALDAEAATLFAVQFFWQVPHLTAIAWLHRADYARAGLKLLPAPDPGGLKAARRIAGYGIALVAASLAPAHFLTTGPVYLTGAVALGFLFFLAAVRFWTDRSAQSARWVLGASLVYLPALLILFAISRRPG